MNNQQRLQLCDFFTQVIDKATFENAIREIEQRASSCDVSDVNDAYVAVNIDASAPRPLFVVSPENIDSDAWMFNLPAAATSRQHSVTVVQPQPATQAANASIDGKSIALNSKSVTSESDSNTTVTSESDVNTTMTTESDVNTIVTTESDVNTTVTTESDVNTTVTTESDANTTVPTESDVNTTVTTESDVNTTVSEDQLRASDLYLSHRNMGKLRGKFVTIDVTRLGAPPLANASPVTIPIVNVTPVIVLPASVQPVTGACVIISPDKGAHVTTLPTEDRSLRVTHTKDVPTSAVAAARAAPSDDVVTEYLQLSDTAAKLYRSAQKVIHKYIKVRVRLFKVYLQLLLI